MSILPAIPVLLLGVVTVWFLWPIVIDPFKKRSNPPHQVDDEDRLAERYFERWSRANPLG